MKSLSRYLKLGIALTILGFVFVIALMWKFDFIPNRIRTKSTHMQIPRPKEVRALRRFYSQQEEFEERRSILQDGCNSDEVVNYKFNFSQSQNIFYVDQTANVSFCKVPKAGSSYLTRVYLALQKKGWDVNKIMGIPRQQIHTLGNKYGTRSSEVIKWFRGVKFLVARDPYSRLFSAYVDKIFLGLHFPNELSLSSPRLRSFCKEPVPFENFLSDVLRDAKMGRMMDRHWSPIYLLCRPCHVKYDVIAKQETLTRDVEYIINSTDIPVSKKAKLRKLSRDKSLRSTVRGLLETYFSKQRIWRKCPDKTNYFRRVWESLQMQGILRDDLPFKLNTGSGIGKLNSKAVTDTILNFILKFPVNSTQKQKQRRVSLVKAYRHVPTKVIQQLQEVFFADFLLFNYSLHPPLDV